MSKKEKFVKMVDELIGTIDPTTLDSDALEYFEMLKAVKETEKPKFTESGKKILIYMQNNKDTYNNMFKAKDIGEGLFISSKAASGALRKLVTDNYVEKIGNEPVTYVLTEKGINVNFTAEEG